MHAGERAPYFLFLLIYVSGRGHVVVPVREAEQGEPRECCGANARIVRDSPLALLSPVVQVPTTADLASAAGKSSKGILN